MYKIYGVHGRSFVSFPIKERFGFNSEIYNKSL